MWHTVFFFFLEHLFCTRLEFWVYIFQAALRLCEIAAQRNSHYNTERYKRGSEHVPQSEGKVNNR